jgi:hypothetical protein
MTDGGWYPCSGSGIYFALWSATTIRFYEIMIYASFPIQWNSFSQTWSTVLADPIYPASNVLSKIVVIDSDTTRQKCIASAAGTAGTGSFKLGFKALTRIKALVLVPGLKTGWTNNQKAVTVTVSNNVSGTDYTCGTISDYNIYTEQQCDKSGNIVTLAREEPNV